MFDKATYNDWEDQVKKFIKDQPIDSFYHEVTSGIKYNPFSVKDNTVPTNGSLSTGKTIIGVAFNSKCTNKNLLLALENGAESIEISISSKTDLNTLFDGIRLDYIVPIINFEDKLASNNFEDFIIGFYSKKVISKTVLFGANDKVAQLDNATLLIKTDERDSVGSLVKLLKIVRNSKTSKLAIKVSIGNQFFLEIARLRALRILIANLYRDLEFPMPEITVIANLSNNVSEESFHNTLIHQTCVALSAYIGGANLVQLQEWGISENRNNDRLNLNIQNILKLESHIDRYHDVMAGSYFVEDLTNKIAQTVWDQL